MKKTARVVGSWWTSLARDGATKRAEDELARLHTSDYSLRTVSKQDATGLSLPPKRTSGGAAYAEDVE
jgi:hypothetical protein